MTLKSSSASLTYLRYILALIPCSFIFQSCIFWSSFFSENGGPNCGKMIFSAPSKLTSDQLYDSIQTQSRLHSECHPDRVDDLDG